MNRTYARVWLQLRHFRSLSSKQRIQAALNALTALRLADGPRFKRNLFRSMLRKGCASGIIRAHNAEEVLEMLAGCGYKFTVEIGDPIVTNHGGRPMDGYSWK